jgi:hypothetical protein
MQKSFKGLLLIALMGFVLVGCEGTSGASEERISALENELGTLRQEFTTFREEWGSFYQDWGTYREEVGLGGQTEGGE